MFRFLDLTQLGRNAPERWSLTGGAGLWIGFYLYRMGKSLRPPRLGDTKLAGLLGFLVGYVAHARELGWRTLNDISPLLSAPRAGRMSSWNQ